MGKLGEKIQVRKAEKMLRLLKNAEEFTKEHLHTRNVGLKLPRTAATICKSLSEDLRSEGNRKKKKKTLWLPFSEHFKLNKHLGIYVVCLSSTWKNGEKLLRKVL